VLVRPHGRPAVAIMVDNTEIAAETLARHNFTMLSEEDLAAEDQ